MLDRNTATARLIREINSLESGIADSLVHAAGLLHSMAMAQRDVGTSGTAAYAAMLRTSKIFQTQLTAQAETKRVHGQLVSISEVVNGPASIEGCPDAEPMGEATTPAVAA